MSTQTQSPADDTTVERNWSRNVTYGARRIAHPASLAEAQELVAAEPHIHALGTRHAFNTAADGPGVLIALDQVPMDLEIDAAAQTATVSGGTRMGDIAQALDDRGWALHNMASLPHISLAGAVATGTHGSGDGLGNLAAAIRALDIIGPDGAVRTVRHGDADFAGSVVGLGALGVVTRVTIAIEPTYEIRQDVYTGLPWDAVLGEFEAVTGAAYSVSLFTRWMGDSIDRYFLKSRATEPPKSPFGATRHTEPIGLFEGITDLNMTQQCGVPGPWWARLPHFRIEHTPSTGEELQSEYLVPRVAIVEALTAVRALREQLAPALQISEIRTMAADDLWLSGAYGVDTVGLHFTWKDRPELVLPLLPELEARLLPLGARPHWGKLFAADGRRLQDHYPRWSDFVELRRRSDPEGKFGNSYLSELFDGR